MSSREPLWYCHQCNAEMRPLLVPDPVCASCHGTFVEKMENPSDDPREFHRGEGGDDVALDPFMMLLQNLMARGANEERPSSPRNRTRTSPPPSFSFSMRSGSGNPATFTIGGARTLGGDAGGRRPPNMSEYIRRGPDTDERGSGIAGPLLAQYLMTMLGHRAGPFSDIMGDVEGGRMGDYVYNQEALDQIITNLMENSNASRPVPATEEIIERLDREILEVGSPTLEKDCAVCKDQFKLETEDPDEQVVVTLPCKHPFHQPCILPWLHSSGTCPVCRHQLVPQPGHHSPPSRDSRSSGGANSSSGPARPRSPGGRDQESGLLHTLFGSVMGSGGAGPSPGSQNRNRRATSSPEQRRNSGSSTEQRRSSPDNSRNANRSNHLPGGWDEELD